MSMKRREFLLRSGAALAALPALSLFTGCVAPRISPRVHDASLGQPWRCSNCGHLTRDHDDISGHRCPRCYKREMERISEEELTAYLREYQAESRD